MDFWLFSLDDRELDLAIAQHEKALEDDKPGASARMELALAAHRAERDRRAALPPTAPPVTGVAPDANDSSESDPSSEATTDKDAAPLALDAPTEDRQAGHERGSRERGSRKRARGAPAWDPRSVRIRFTPMRFGERAPERGASKKRRYESPELQEQFEANRVARAQLLGNQAAIEDTALHFACALTAQRGRAVQVTPNGKRHDTKVQCPWMGPQIRKLAVADDGYYYDFQRITRYIRDNVHRQLLSPRTGAPMSGQVYHVGKCKKTKCPKTLVWTPDIFSREELHEPESDSETATETTACVAVD
jgi:hypothetical protein